MPLSILALKNLDSATKMWFHIQDQPSSKSGQASIVRQRHYLKLWICSRNLWGCRVWKVLEKCTWRGQKGCKTRRNYCGRRWSWREPKIKKSSSSSHTSLLDFESRRLVCCLQRTRTKCLQQSRTKDGSFEQRVGRRHLTLWLLRDSPRFERSNCRWRFPFKISRKLVRLSRKFGHQFSSTSILSFAATSIPIKMNWRSQNQWQSLLSGSQITWEVASIVYKL